MKRAIIFLALAMFVVTTHAQQNSFIDRFLELRQPIKTEGYNFQILNQEDIQALPFAVATEEERLRVEKFWANVKQFAIFLDMGTEVSLCQLYELLRPHERLLLIRTEDSKFSLYGTIEENKIIELIIVVASDTDIELFNLLFREPFDFRELAENPDSFHQLISINGTEEEQRNTVISFRTNRSELDWSTLDIPAPGFDTRPFTLEVVQVDGQYIVRTVEEEMRHMFTRRDFYTKPIIFGSNPGNTYVRYFGKFNEYLLADRYGFLLAQGEKITPVFVLGCEEEIAAFIIWHSRFGYDLYECPEVYTMIRIERGWIPNNKRRVRNAQSIVVTEDGYFRVVKEDGAVEYIPIRRQATNQ